MKGREYIIMGFFWQGDPLASYVYDFKGDVRFSDNENFTGDLSDGYGKSKIKGNLVDGWLKFIKQYLPGQRGADVPISCSLKTQIYKSDEKIISGGWKGTYKIIGVDGEKTTGEMNCLIY